MNEFKKPEDLSNWIISMGIDVSQWGKGSAKALNNLWDEYVNGDAAFETNPPRRVVQVVQVLIRRDGQILVEAAQEFVNGQYRYRNRPPSEKIKPGENVYEAARRCLNEELGLREDQVSIDLSKISKHEKLNDSPSYPGLLTHYTLTIVYAASDDLPMEAFWRENEAVGSGDPIRRHLWDWINAEL